MSGTDYDPDIWDSSVGPFNTDIPADPKGVNLDPDPAQ